MRSAHSLLTTGLAAAPLFGASNAWLIQLWASQSTCYNEAGVAADTSRGGLAYQNNTCMAIGITDVQAIEISDWDDGCNITIYRASTYGLCFDEDRGTGSAVIWGPYSKEQWIEEDATMKQYNKTCLPQKDIGATSEISYICPSNDTSSSSSSTAVGSTLVTSTISASKSDDKDNTAGTQVTGAGSKATGAGSGSKVTGSDSRVTKSGSRVTGWGAKVTAEVIVPEYKSSKDTSSKKTRTAEEDGSKTSSKHAKTTAGTASDDTSESSTTSKKQTEATGTASDENTKTSTSSKDAETSSTTTSKAKPTTSTEAAEPKSTTSDEKSSTDDPSKSSGSTGTGSEGTGTSSGKKKGKGKGTV